MELENQNENSKCVMLLEYLTFMALSQIQRPTLTPRRVFFTFFDYFFIFGMSFSISVR